MEDPVVLSSGHTYDREAVKNFFRDKGPKDPKTGQPVNPESQLDNNTLKESIITFMVANP